MNVGRARFNDGSLHHVCVLKCEKVFQLRERKILISKGNKRKTDYSIELTLFMPQYGSVEKILDMHLHCTGISCEDGANSCFRFSNFLLEIS